MTTYEVNSHSFLFPLLSYFVHPPNHLITKSISFVFLITFCLKNKLSHIFSNNSYHLTNHIKQNYLWHFKVHSLFSLLHNITSLILCRICWLIQLYCHLIIWEHENKSNRAKATERQSQTVLLTARRWAENIIKSLT